MRGDYNRRPYNLEPIPEILAEPELTSGRTGDLAKGNPRVAYSPRATKP